MTCREVHCARKAKPDTRLCQSHYGALIDRVLRGKR